MKDQPSKLEASDTLTQKSHSKKDLQNAQSAIDMEIGQ